MARFEPDPRLETLIRKQSETRGSRDALEAQMRGKGAISAEDTAMDGANLESDADDETPEAKSSREARQRIQRQVTALARSEPRAVAQVIRSWLTEGK
jgi:flagellar biosynthesis/type III secretory pathway M-ring protein FliF/YscJ